MPEFSAALPDIIMFAAPTAPTPRAQPGCARSQGFATSCLNQVYAEPLSIVIG
jgi:hypothetical protein